MSSLTLQLLTLLSYTPEPYCISVVNLPFKENLDDFGIPIIHSGHVNNDFLCSSILIFAESLDFALSFSDSNFQHFEPSGKVILVLSLALNDSDVSALLSAKAYASSVDTILVSKRGRDSLVFTHDVSKIGQSKEVNRWKSGRFVKSTENSIFKETLRDLNRRVLRVSTFHYEPFVGIYQDPDGNETYGGIEV